MAVMRSLKAQFPFLLTVLKDAAEPRPFSAKRVMAYKGAKSLMDLEKLTEGNSLLYTDTLRHEYEEKNLFIPTLTIDKLALTLRGAESKVHQLKFIKLTQ